MSAQFHTWADAVGDPMTPLPARVRQVHRELADTFTLELEPPAGLQSLEFKPGQFNMIYRFGMGEVPISISGDPNQPGVLIHTIRSVGSITEALSRLAPGQSVGIRGPFGSAWPVEDAEGSDVVVIAGGIGLAPLRPMLYRLLARRERYGNICIYYGARSPAEILYREELEAWRGRFDLNVEVTVDRAGRDWRGRVGVVTKLISKQGFDPTEAQAFICGPEVMMRYSVMSLNKLGVGNDRIYMSMERNMKCAIGLCGHCQYGGDFVCRDGPVFRFESIAQRFNIREI